MKTLDVAELRSKIDDRYVDFAQIRTLLGVSTVAEDSGVKFSDPSYEGEIRGQCPLCGKDKSFCVNLNTNRFNCFGKECRLKGGGVLDFMSKLHRISAREASQLLACAYGLPPYSGEPIPERNETQNHNPKPAIRGNGVESVPGPEDPITRSEFNDLKERFDRLSKLMFKYIMDNDEPGGIAEEYDPPLTKHHVTQ